MSAQMPPLAPLEMDAQNLRARPPARPTTGDRSTRLWRIATFLPALAGTALMVRALHSWFADQGMSSLEWALLAMIGLTFVWVTLSVSTVAVALAGLRTRLRSERAETARPLEVALLVPIYNEVPSDVFGNAAAMLADLARRAGPHRYSLFILSDTRDEAIAAEELLAFARLRAEAPAGLPIHYRRRADNNDRKVGNIKDWVSGWGAAYEAMLVLDADSLMSGRAIDRLATALSTDPDAGLIQSFPVLIGARTLFARMQQFSNIAYGWLLAEGLALWARTEGNYWGHNAIIRTRAFATSAGLPHIGKDSLILSHDFVEAGLLRRAGWRVRFLPGVSGSYEETPGTLIDYVLRDRRWCRGNLQHLRLLGTRGLHPVSRFHLLHGAVAYLLSPAWFVLLVFWALLGVDADTNVIRYFNEANPLFPDWPPAMSHIDSAVFLAIMYAMLLTPKLTGAMAIALSPKAVRLYGGKGPFLGAVVTEILLSVAYAPVLMIQQTGAVLRATLGKGAGWTPQRRTAQGYPLRTLIAFHWVETLLGVVLTVGLLSGLVSLWLLPIVISLTCAIPLSALSALPVVEGLPRALRMQSPHVLREPAIVARARAARLRIADQLEAKETLPVE
ncbi:MAG: glucans biosynthesis glucosyltransferase MdoH [Sulfitobacter sp.]|nr:glucans biosynthesis glucosyltransferase MdoH [Sulfitobacter sp.]